MEAWVRSHEKQDDERHSEILDDIEDLMLRSMTVSSSISKGEKEYAKLNGMKVAAVMFFGAFATIAGLIVAWFHK